MLAGAQSIRRDLKYAVPSRTKSAVDIMIFSNSRDATKMILRTWRRPIPVRGNDGSDRNERAIADALVVRGGAVFNYEIAVELVGPGWRFG